METETRVKGSYQEYCEKQIDPTFCLLVQFIMGQALSGGSKEPGGTVTGPNGPYIKAEEWEKTRQKTIRTATDPQGKNCGDCPKIPRVKIVALQQTRNKQERGELIGSTG